MDNLELRFLIIAPNDCLKSPKVSAQILPEKYNNVFKEIRVVFDEDCRRLIMSTEHLERLYEWSVWGNVGCIVLLLLSLCPSLPPMF